jgi:hypothetical protein
MSFSPSSRTIVCKEVFDENSIPSEEGKDGCFDYLRYCRFYGFRFRRRYSFFIHGVCMLRVTWTFQFAKHSCCVLNVLWQYRLFVADVRNVRKVVITTRALRFWHTTTVSNTHIWAGFDKLSYTKNLKLYFKPLFVTYKSERNLEVFGKIRRACIVHV